MSNSAYLTSAGLLEHLRHTAYTIEGAPRVIELRPMLWSSRRRNVDRWKKTAESWPMFDERIRAPKTGNYTKLWASLSNRVVSFPVTADPEAHGMCSVTPLPAHPELKIIHGRAWTEYRVQSSRARGSTNSSQKWLQCFWIDAVVCLCVAMIWPLVCGSSLYKNY